MAATPRQRGAPKRSKKPAATKKRAAAARAPRAPSAEELHRNDAAWRKLLETAVETPDPVISAVTKRRKAAPARGKAK